MTDKNDLEQDEQFERLLRPLGADAAPVNQSAIDQAINAARAKFDAGSANTASTDTAAIDTASTHAVSTDAASTTTKTPNVTILVADSTTEKAKPMFALTKSIALLAVSAVMVIAALVVPTQQAVGDVTLGRVLDQAINADMLQLKVVREGVESDVWIQAGQKLRWEDTAKHYSIADGSRLWRIDETQQSVIPESNPWLRSDAAEIDLIALLGVDPLASSTFRSATAIRQIEHAGAMCNMFQVETSVEGTSVFICAFADVETNELYSIGSWPNADVVNTQAPVAELRFVAINVPVDEDKFAVNGALSEDNRIGKIIDAQGIVLLRPQTSSRWTPVAGPMIVKQGDWLRTDVRGANAASIKLTSQFNVVLGPGSLLEFRDPHKLKLHRGEVQMAGGETANGELTLNGPNDQSVSVATNTTKHVRIDQDETLANVDQKPLWLQGFEGTTSNESIGSLIANVDGRSVPLTVGFHKVKVEIRDQIARTTIEESFVNHTHRRMEGVFHFPLPQDASISGFGMWIGGELIEADVVEKQRAREIYETILRERRDPGLLEWSGGNIFKARVFPIEPHSEKRIKIVYTQVLPLRANQYRYSYGLRSELLQKNPLRELSLEVLVNSAIPLKSVHSPTHIVRSQTTDNSARLEFSAQEYTPKRDFEVVYEIDSQQSDVVVIPHRRGEDGYFLAQVTPPSAAGNWQREVLPDGRPMRLLLVCDTSGSMDSNNRDSQDQFVTSILSTLGPDDRFNIAMCDVDCEWRFPGNTAPNDEQTATVRDWLASRRSLGWTDLDRMTKSVLTQLAAHDNQELDTHVIYIGDGIVTSGDADPQAFMNRMRTMTNDLQGSTFHAVSVGSSFESGVLKSIAAVGGGSVRQIDGEQTPQRTAHELLNEIAQPGLRNMKVEFRGLKVAAVYPETLPNLSAGTQQIIIGRYLPQGEDQTGEIIVTGERNGEPVTYSSRITLKDAEAGNSFIPRLWARAHLETLLQQGNNPSIKDDIIALSEDFHIMTPYTSLLVLETDEDRERFGVKRRYLMRDGERFFADGRDSASFELLQQQMKAAGEWRLGLRRRVLRELSGLGRDSQGVQQMIQLTAQLVANEYKRSSSTSWFDREAPAYQYGGKFDGGWAWGLEGRMGGIGGGGFGGGGGGFINGSGFADDMDESNGFISGGSFDLNVAKERLSEELTDVDFEAEAFGDGFKLSAIAGSGRRDRISTLSRPGLSLAKQQLASNRGIRFEAQSQLQSAKPRSLSAMATGGFRLNQPMYSSYGGSYSGDPWQYTRWVDKLFPALPMEPGKPKPVVSEWPADAKAISQQLMQPVANNSGGLRLRSARETFDPRWDRTTSKSTETKYASQKRWLHYSNRVGSQTVVNWCDGKNRGVYSRAFHLGQTRKAEGRDISAYRIGFRPHAETPLHDSYPQHSISITRPADGQIVLALTSPNKNSKQRQRITIDTERNIVLMSESLVDDKLTSQTRYEDFVQRAGAWWPQLMTTTDKEGKTTSVTKLAIDELNAKTFGAEYTNELPKDDVDQLVVRPEASVKEAKVAAAGGKASFTDQLVLLLSEMQVQHWDEVLKRLESLKALTGDKPGMDWIELAVLQAARKNEEARQLGIRLAEGLVDQPSTDELFLANYLLGQLGSVVDQNEMLSLLDELEPLFGRQPKHVLANRQLEQKRANSLVQLGRRPEALVIWRELSATAPWDTGAAVTYAQQLNTSGDVAAAKAWLRERLDTKDYNAYEREQFRNAYAGILRQHNATEELVTFLAEWVDENPEGQSAYNQYLSAIMSANRYAEANKQAQQWIDAGQKNEKLTPPELVRLNAAVSFALGDRYGQSLYRIDSTWLKPLEKAALFFLGHEHHFDVATKIVNHYRIRNTDERDRVVAEAARRLKAAPAELKPNVVASYVSWSHQTLTVDDWTAIANVLRSRWDDQKDVKVQDVLGGSLQQIYKQHLVKRHLPFMRERITRAEAADPVDDVRVASFRLALFNQLLSLDWDKAHEAEALDLLTGLSGATSKMQQLADQVAALHRLVDRMLESRFQAAMKAFQANDKPEELTRTEYREKVIAFRTSARKELADVLSEQVVKLGVEPNSAEKPFGQLTDWFNLERMHLDVGLNQNLPETIAAAWTFLGAAPVRVEVDDDHDDSDKVEERVAFEQIRQAFQQRVLILLSNLAVRKSAAKDLTDQVMAYIDAGIALGGDEADDWKSRKLAMLVVLDQPEPIERNLRNWIREDEFPATWQLTLGRVVAEQGKIDEAIQLFESVKRDQKTLPPADFAALAKWYLVTDRQDDYRNARVETFMASPEWQISNWINQQRQPWYRTDVPLPTELDKNVLFAFQALFRKSNQPGNYTRQLREFYTSCRDFRLLQMVPDAVVGRTPQQVYHFLSSLDSNLLDELRNEATADEIMQRLVEVRESAKSPIDERACDLLEAMIERRSAEVLNQPGPHIEAAVAALKRAFEHDWADGEVVQMAAFLDKLGRLKHGLLNDERIRQLKALLKMTESGSDENLSVAWSLAHALYFSDKGLNAERTESISVMEVAIREFEQANPGGWPARVNTQTAGYIDLFKRMRRYARAEGTLLTQLKHPTNPTQADWLRNQLNSVYIGAFEHDGRVVLGGDNLYANLLKHLLGQADSSNPQSQSAVFSSLNTFFRIAHTKKIKTAHDDLRSYAYEQFPGLLRADANRYRNDVNSLRQTLRDVLGPKDALQFLIARVEGYPMRLSHTYQSAWQQFGYELARYRFETKSAQLKELEPRLLAIVLKQIREDLQSPTRHYHNSIYRHHDRYFWKEKAGDFLQTAEEVLKNYPDSARTITRIATFLYNDLGQYSRAIEVMVTAHKKGLLNSSQQFQVCQWMHSQKRYAESIPILEPLVKSSPDTMSYRTMLITAYGHSDRKEQMRMLLTETDERFRKPGLWTESNMVQLAAVCLKNDLNQECTVYYAEAIDLHQRTAPNRGIGNGTLSNYYTEQAKAFAELNKTIEAVDAASAGIIAWGRNASQRGNSTYWLKRIINESKKLDGYAEHLDQQAEKNGTDSPLIRKMVGIAYSGRNQHKQALKHLRIAIELQPNDSETQEALIATYVALKDTDGAVAQMLAMLDYDRHNLKLYKRLAETLKDNEVESERALTSIVEAAPLEAEHHQSLAEFREAGNRWTEAIPHWKHVARLRALEPTGLINLAEAQIHEKQWTEAQATLDSLNRTKWPSRFNNVTGQVRNLQNQIPKKK